MTLRSGFFATNLIVKDENKQDIIQVANDSKTAAKELEEFFRKYVKECQELVKISVTDSEISSFLVSANINFEKLTDLNLGGNILSKWTTNSSFTKLVNVDLSHNRFSSIPIGLFKRCEHSLKTLNMRHNLIKTLTDDDLKYLYKLTVLDLSQNRITDIENIYQKCVDLEELYLISNQIKAVPPLFYNNLKKLRKLYLSGNPISELHVDVEKLRDLEELGISFTNIKQLPQSIVQLGKLKRILVDNTPLTEPKLACAKRGIQAIKEYFLDAVSQGGYGSLSIAPALDGSSRAFLHKRGESAMGSNVIVVQPRGEELDEEESKGAAIDGNNLGEDGKANPNPEPNKSSRIVSSPIHSIVRHLQESDEEKSVLISSKIIPPPVEENGNSRIERHFVRIRTSHTDVAEIMEAFEKLVVQYTAVPAADQLASIVGKLKANLVDDNKKVLLAYVHVNDEKLYKYLVRMMEHNDMYAVTQQLSYVVDYLQEYVDAYRQHENLRNNRLTAQNVSIMDLYRLRDPNFYIHIDDTQFRTKISVSIELQKILKHCGFAFNKRRSADCLFIAKSTEKYLFVNEIKHYLEKVIGTPIEIMNAS